MKPEEAIEVLNEILDVLGYAHYSNSREYIAIDCAIQALEKQVAKKPIPEELNDGSTWNHCPCCNQVWQDKQHYCHYCGQKINWEETP